jgi:hypothetical protein
MNNKPLANPKYIPGIIVDPIAAVYVNLLFGSLTLAPYMIPANNSANTTPNKIDIKNIVSHGL